MIKKYLLVMLLSVPVVACDKGYEDHEGVCAARDIKPDYGPEAINATIPSNELPPNHGGIREDVKPVDAPSQMKKDKDWDDSIKDADAQGKAAAGLK